ncbi:potassium channel family protein [Streptomyces sp. NPDC051133]|uniref:potassium channel family protein n=1 Tax=Streptomyces sp. NPDC051133 TaxID=3155521 RepID=UPI003438E6A2
MKDPVAARTERTPPDDAPFRGRPGRRATALSIARTLGTAIGLVTAYYLLPLNRPATVGTSLILLGGLLAVVLVFAWEAWTIMRSPHPRLKAVEAVAITVCAYLVLFASTYYLIERALPGSFSEHMTRTDALYFTVTTFSTVGFGDITALSQAGRIVVTLQMVGGLLLVGVAVRVLSAAVRAGLRRQGREPPQ